MNELRIKRYHDKIHHIIDYIQELPIKPRNELEKRGIFYSLQTSIEAMVDLIAMCVKDLGIQVKEDIINISKIVEVRKLDPELGENLKNANGLRNIIVHRYNKIDELLILDSVESIKNLLIKWISIVEEIMDEIK